MTAATSSVKVSHCRHHLLSLLTSFRRVKATAHILAATDAVYRAARGPFGSVPDLDTGVLIGESILLTTLNSCSTSSAPGIDGEAMLVDEVAEDGL